MYIFIIIYCIQNVCISIPCILFEKPQSFPEKHVFPLTSLFVYLFVHLVDPEHPFVLYFFCIINHLIYTGDGESFRLLYSE